jgi:hypothetical protein
LQNVKIWWKGKIKLRAGSIERAGVGLPCVN